MSAVQVGDKIRITEGYTPFHSVTQGETYEIVKIVGNGRMYIENDNGVREYWTRFIPDEMWKDDHVGVELVSNNNENDTMPNVQEGDEFVITDLESAYETSEGNNLVNFGDLTEGRTYVVNHLNDGGNICFNDDNGDMRTITSNDYIQFKTMNNVDFQEGDIVRVTDDFNYNEEVQVGDLFRIINRHDMEPVSSKYDNNQTYLDGTLELVHRVESDPFDGVTLNGYNVDYNSDSDTLEDRMESDPFDGVTLNGYNVDYNSDSDTLEVGCNSLDVEAVLDVVDKLNEVRS